MGIAFAILASPAAAQEADPDAKIARLIQDLGSDDFKVRERAEEELRKIGSPAIPALKKALEDGDAERADRARKIVADLEKTAPASGKERKAPTGGVRSTFRDLSRGITLETHPDGRVELTVPEEDKETGKKVYKTYKADSLEGFKEKHPEIAKQYGVDGMMPRIEWGQGPGWDPEKFFEDFRKQFEDDRFGKWDWRSPMDGDLKKWMENQRKRFDELRKGWGPRGEGPAEKRTPTGDREFGIRVDLVNETLAAQLELKEGEGVQVTEVKPDSVAEKSGLKKHDVIVKMNGKPIQDKWEFRKNVREALGSGFELEVVRSGKRETIKVK